MCEDFDIPTRQKKGVKKHRRCRLLIKPRKNCSYAFFSVFSVRGVFHLFWGRKLSFFISKSTIMLPQKRRISRKTFLQKEKWKQIQNEKILNGLEERNFGKWYFQSPLGTIYQLTFNFKVRLKWLKNMLGDSIRILICYFSMSRWCFGIKKT